MEVEMEIDIEMENRKMMEEHDAKNKRMVDVGTARVGARKRTERIPRYFDLGYPDDALPPKETLKTLYARSTISLSFNMNFSSIAIERFSQRLFGDEERYMKKLVYLCVSPLSSSPVNMSWLAINGNDGPEGKEVSVACVYHAMTNPESGFPSELLGLSCYGCAVWNSSKIIIAGGKNCKGDPSDKVFIYDTFSKTWEPPLRMNTRRGEKPIVIVADTKIFVFGGFDNPWIDVSWAQVYDSSWYQLPMHPILDFNPKIISHAVYPRRNQILFWLHDSVVLSFNYCRWNWERYDKPMSIAAGPQWSATVVVFEDFLIWHHYRTIYAHDLLNDVTIPMYTLPHTDFYSALFSSDVPPPGFLVHIGRSKLCLFYQVGSFVYYIKFLVQISEGVGPPIPHTVVGHSGFLKTPPVTDVNQALEISS